MDVNSLTSVILMKRQRPYLLSKRSSSKYLARYVKKEHYCELFPTYIYCLSSWFKVNCKYELIVLERAEIPVFWGDSLTYKEDIIDYIVNF